MSEDETGFARSRTNASPGARAREGAAPEEPRDVAVAPPSRSETRPVGWQGKSDPGSATHGRHRVGPGEAFPERMARGKRLPHRSAPVEVPLGEWEEHNRLEGTAEREARRE